MATRKTPKKPKIRRAHHIEVPTKPGAKPQDVHDKIKEALDDFAATEVFEPGDIIIVSNEEGGGGGRTLKRGN